MKEILCQRDIYEVEVKIPSQERTSRYYVINGKRIPTFVIEKPNHWQTDQFWATTVGGSSLSPSELDAISKRVDEFVQAEI